MHSLDLHLNSDSLLEARAGVEIFAEGAEGDEMYIVIEGEVLITLRGKTLGVATVGEIVGEMALLKATVRSATATAQTDCVLDAIDKDRFQLLVKKSPAFALYVMNVLADRIRLTNEFIAASED